MSHYEVIARLGDGRRLYFDPGRRARSLRIRGIYAAEKVRVSVTAVARDGLRGRASRAAVRLRPPRPA